MNTSLSRGSAKLYEFPLRGRFAATHKDSVRSEESFADLPAAVFGGSWYHEAALKDADRARKP